MKIALLSHTPKQALVNLETALPAVVGHIKGGWDNIQSLHIKTSTSVSLPIWTCDLGSEEGGRWNGLVAEDITKAAEDASEEENDEEEEEDKVEAAEQPEKAVGIKRRLEAKTERSQKRAK